MLFSADRRSALYALPLRDDVEVREAVSGLEAFVDRNADERVELLLGGPLLAETTLGDHVLADLASLVPVMLAVMALLLAITFRCLGGPLAGMSGSTRGTVQMRAVGGPSVPASGGAGLAVLASAALVSGVVFMLFARRRAA